MNRKPRLCSCSPPPASAQPGPATPSTPRGPTPPQRLLEKPPVVCAVLSPNRYPPQDVNRAKNQRLPDHGICDYLLLDAALEPDMSFTDLAYGFLTSRNYAGKVLFALDGHTTSDYYNIAKSREFQTSVDDLKNKKQLDLKGFGNFRQVPRHEFSKLGLPGTFDLIYNEFHNLLQHVGVPEQEQANFLVLQPSNFYSEKGTYEGLFQQIKGSKIKLVIFVTLSDTDSDKVQASSSFDNDCLTEPPRNTMGDVLEIISAVQAPTYKFALTLSLQMDIYLGVALSSLLQQSSLPTINSQTHEIEPFETTCGPQAYSRSNNQKFTSVSFGNGGCTFAEGENNAVVSFETPDTIRHKMDQVYLRLGYNKTKTHVIGWLIYNVTFGIAPPDCGGDANRIKAVRDFIDAH